jgi:hypothetical protein
MRCLLGFIFMILLAGCGKDDENLHGKDDDSLLCACTICLTNMGCGSKGCKYEEWNRESTESCTDAAPPEAFNGASCCDTIHSVSISESKINSINIFNFANTKFPFKPQIQVKSRFLLVSLTDSTLESKGNLNQTSLNTQYQGGCPAQCANKDSPYCLTLNASNSPVLYGQLEKLASLFLNHNGTVYKKDILSAFSATDDPCERTDIAISEGNLTNEGSSCVFSTSVSIGTTSINVIKVKLPRELRGIVAKTNDIDVRFKSRKHTGKLIIDGLLNNDFGGFISSIQYSRGKLFVGTESGCIVMEKIGFL